MVLVYIIIGIVQGITEFLPVSSSGHILLLSEIFGIEMDIIFLSVIAHLGTLLSVIICMWGKIKHCVRHPFCETNWKLVMATLPSVIIVLLFNNFVNKLYSIYFLVIGFVITAILLTIAEMHAKTKPFGCKQAICMGIMQGIAVLPGISRSGSTMAIGMMSGADKSEACEFTFLMSIPIIIASAVFESVQAIKSGVNVEFLPMAIVFVTSFIFGILSIKLMLKTLKSNKLFVFSIYLIVMAIATILVI